MNIKQLTQYITNKSKKVQPITESAEYTVVKSLVIPHSLTHTGIAGTTKTIQNPDGGKTAVLLKFKDGKITTGVGKTKEEAIAQAVEAKAAIFKEENITEAKYPVLHDTLHSAVQTALAYTKKDGYTISDEEEFNKITTAYKNLGIGKTDEFHLELYKNGKPQSKMLHIQVYRMDTGRYELNFYVA
jgi:hypothetical protein